MQYADCLEGLGLTVSPAAGRTDGLDGYVEIAGATYMMIDGAVEAGPDVPIAVDGVDRDAEIRDCHADNEGAKDAFINSNDAEVYEDDGWAEAGVQRFDAGVEWAECARDAGVSTVADPKLDVKADIGTVILPEGLSLDEAAMLGEVCSRPMALEWYTDPEAEVPLFGFEVMGDLTPYADAVDGPFSDVVKECQNLDPDECAAELGW
ncbi:hypothetical protein [Myceligenerans xiligouense]|uniref:hypothetical protein n=1 Tax=Myceligenerans xiligouense TaxID=253184 RepID=UPI0011CE351B|nr:hypothetical protein [Myceligenerans xiligouense]